MKDKVKINQGETTIVSLRVPNPAAKSQRVIVANSTLETINPRSLDIKGMPIAAQQAQEGFVLSTMFTDDPNKPSSNDIQFDTSFNQLQVDLELFEESASESSPQQTPRRLLLFQIRG
jgi:hypothetical protein